MTDLLIRLFVKNPENTADPDVRTRYGTLGSVTGIVVNLLLALLKYVVGRLTLFLSVTADAANNLSDAAASLVSLFTVRLARKPVDREHPYGHGRVEYLGALVVGALILVMGVDLLRESVRGILSPDPTVFRTVPFILLCISLPVKLWLFFFYRKLGRRVDSAPLLAASRDSVSDVLATGAVVAGMLITRFTGLPLDGWLGLLVALLILRAGWQVCKETVDDLLGGKTNRELGEQIVSIVLDRDKVLGVHDLMIHDYGPGRCIASIHAEVPADGNILELHEVIDQAERDVEEKLHIPICIHMDPVVTGDPETDALRQRLDEFLAARTPPLRLHDFRRVPGERRTNLIFDVAVPPDFGDTSALEQDISAFAKTLDPRHVCVIHFDTDFYHQNQP